VYIWVQPDTPGRHLGQYEPAIYLVSPKKQQLVSVGADYVFNTHTSVKTEFAMSNYDVNTFSSKDKGNDVGLAGRVVVTDVRKLSSATVGRQIQTDLGYEYVQAQFKPLERLRNVEFNRDWSLPYVINAADERLLNASLGIDDKQGGRFRYEIVNYNRSDNFNGFKHQLDYITNVKGWRIANNISFTNINSTDQQGTFLRPTVDVSKLLKSLRNITIGVNYSREHNKLSDKKSDTLTPFSYAFNVWQAYIKSDNTKLNKWGITYFTRSDYYPVTSKLQQADKSNNISFNTELMANERHQVKFNITYRKLSIIDPGISRQKEDKSRPILTD